MSVISRARSDFHNELCKRLYGKKKSGAYSNADSSSKVSLVFAEGMGEELSAAGLSPTRSPISKAQTVGKEFSAAITRFLETCYRDGFQRLHPAVWEFKEEALLSEYLQYSHINDLNKLRKDFLTPAEGQQPEYEKAALVGGDYHVKHDVLMFRSPESIADLNLPGREELIGATEASVAVYTPLLKRNQVQEGLTESPKRKSKSKASPQGAVFKPIIHAAISVKWTLRSDRAQNVRTEALNLQKHRKGRTPNLVAVTAEPLPSRLASLALGTGEIDCVYHVALSELLAGAVKAVNEKDLHPMTIRARRDQLNMLRVLIAGRQLRDIADLPFDLAL